MQHNYNAGILDRIIVAASYLTLGFAGLIWIIINALLIKRPFGSFLMSNLIQSFVISIIYAIITYIYEILSGILINLPFIGGFFYKLHVFLFMTPTFHTFSFINYIIFIFTSYLAIFAFLGKLPYVPFVTEITKRLYR